MTLKEISRLALFALAITVLLQIIFRMDNTWFEQPPNDATIDQVQDLDL